MDDTVDNYAIITKAESRMYNPTKKQGKIYFFHTYFLYDEDCMKPLSKWLKLHLRRYKRNVTHIRFNLLLPLLQ